MSTLRPVVRSAAFLVLGVTLGACSGGVNILADASVGPCGDGVLNAGEWCDGPDENCVDLGGSWSAGTASCRADCSGWDVGACTAADSTRFEIVQPAFRKLLWWSDAACNDESPFAFYIRPNLASHDWVIYLEGGGFCDDNAADCTERTVSRPDLVTTVDDNDHALVPAPADGLVNLDSTVNPFADANLVFAHYCSSDFWVGNTPDMVMTQGGENFYFGGRKNVEAMLEILVERYGLADSDPSLRVLFAGGSAGGFGAHLNAWQVEALLPQTKAGQRLLIGVDAGWWIPWEDDGTGMHLMGTAVTGDPEVAIGMRSFWQTSFDPDCEGAQTAAGEEVADCLFGELWYPHVSDRVPVFVQQSREDRAFALGDHNLVEGSPELADWHDQVETSLQIVPQWLFSGGEPYHMIGLSDPMLYVGPAPGMTFVEALGRFWVGDPVGPIVFTSVAPAVLINKAPTQLDPATMGPIQFIVQTSEEVVDLYADDVWLGDSTAAGPLTASMTALGTGGTKFRVEVMGMTGPGDVIVSIPADSATDTGPQLNGNQTSVGGDYIVDFMP